MPLRNLSQRSDSSARSSESVGTSSSTSKRPSIHYDDPPLFREAKLLSYELCEQCRIYFEEGLCKSSGQLAERYF